MGEKTRLAAGKNDDLLLLYNKRKTVKFYISWCEESILNARNCNQNEKVCHLRKDSNFIIFT